MLGGIIWKVCVHNCLPVSSSLREFILFSPPCRSQVTTGHSGNCYWNNVQQGMDGLLIVQDLRLKLLHLATNLLPAVIQVWVSFTNILMHLSLNMYVSGVVIKLILLIH